MIPIETERLVLRDWREEDLDPFFHLNADPEVMEFFPSVLTRDESDAFATEIRRRVEVNGVGFWAVEEKVSRRFIGFVGLNTPQIEMPFPSAMEVGWRLVKHAWGRGYATEAAKASLRIAFEDVKVPEVVSFTSILNTRSIAVMERIGLRNRGRTFVHPSVPPNHRLSEHVLYSITQEQWFFPR